MRLKRLLTIVFALLSLLAFVMLAGCSRQPEEQKQNITTAVEVLSLQSLREEGRGKEAPHMFSEKISSSELGLTGGLGSAFNYFNGIPFLIPRVVLETLLNLNASSPDGLLTFNHGPDERYRFANTEEKIARHAQGLVAKNIVIRTAKTFPFLIGFYAIGENPVRYPAHLEVITEPGVYHLFTVENGSYNFDVYESKGLWPDASVFAGWYMADSRELFERMQPINLLLIGDSFTASIGYVSPGETGLTKEGRAEFLLPSNWVILER